MVTHPELQGGSPVEEDVGLPKLLRVEEAAVLAGVSRATLYGYIANGQLPSITIGRSRRVPLPELTKWLESQVAKRTTPAKNGL